MEPVILDIDPIQVDEIQPKQNNNLRNALLIGGAILLL